MGEGTHVCTNDGNCFEFEDPCDSCLSEKQRLELVDLDRREAQVRLAEELNIKRKLIHRPEFLRDLVRIDQGRMANYTRLAPRSEPGQGDLIRERGYFDFGVTKETRELM